MIEQDHWRIKQRIRPMLGFKRFDSAAVTISGIELVQKIQKHQFKSAHCAAAQLQRPNSRGASSRKKPPICSPPANHLGHRFSRSP
jgi:hypothetical protein